MDGLCLFFLTFSIRSKVSKLLKQILSALYEKHFRLSANVKFNKFDATIPVEKPVDNTALLRLIGGKRTAPKAEKQSNEGQHVDTEDDGKNGANGGGEGSQSRHSQPMPKWFKMK